MFLELVPSFFSICIFFSLLISCIPPPPPCIHYPHHHLSSPRPNTYFSRRSMLKAQNLHRLDLFLSIYLSIILATCFCVRCIVCLFVLIFFLSRVQLMFLWTFAFFSCFFLSFTFKLELCFQSIPEYIIY